MMSKPNARNKEVPKKKLLETQRELLSLKAQRLQQAEQTAMQIRQDLVATIEKIAIELGVPAKDVKAWALSNNAEHLVRVGERNMSLPQMASKETPKETE